MKKTNIKGFTLIELIVVMAIFSIIMFGAMSLMKPVSKSMIQSEIYESGNAAVRSITNYLEGQLTPAEFLDVYNYKLTDIDKDTIAQNFAQYYYEGVLRSGSGNGTPGTTPMYANGKVHVMIINNTPNAEGKVNSHIENYVYNVNTFKPGSVTVSLDSSATISSAINKAYYDNYRFEIKLGTYDDTTFTLTPLAYETFAGNANAKNTAFTIRSTTNKKVNNNVYSFLTNASMSLTNINGRSLGSLNYYVIDDDPGADAGITSDNNRSIVQIAQGSIHTYDAGKSPLGRSSGSLTKSSRVFYKSTGAALDSYTFVYSYGSEINTN